MWFYRVVGPFSVPDFARGSYATILTLRALHRFMNGWEDMTVSTSMLLKIGGEEGEVDFVAWHGRRFDGDLFDSPRLVVREAKSLGKGKLVDVRDVRALKLIGKYVPRSVLVVAVLKEDFLPEETNILAELAEWGRRDEGTGEVANPVVVLTARELFNVDSIQQGGNDLIKKVATSRGIYGLADATQQAYLGMSSFDEWRRGLRQVHDAESGVGGCLR
jgi:hypothetical protein